MANRKFWFQPWPVEDNSRYIVNWQSCNSQLRLGTRDVAVRGFVL